METAPALLAINAMQLPPLGAAGRPWRPRWAWLIVWPSLPAVAAWRPLAASGAVMEAAPALLAINAMQLHPWALLGVPGGLAGRG